MGFAHFDIDSIESYVSNHLRLFISMAAGILAFVGIIAVVIFFVAVRGAEQVMIPEVRGKELTEALMELQEKELYPRLQLRYSQSAREKGLILEQDPKSGTIVKAGRRVRLVVSQGVIVNSVENYIGRTVDEVRMDLRTLFASGQDAQPLLSLKEPFMYEYSSEAPGTILQQHPLPGTEIAGPTVLEFVVSQGPENAVKTIPALTGLSVAEALERIGSAGVDFTFTLREPRDREQGETVVFQNPPGEARASAGTVVQITVTTPAELPEGEAFGLFKYTMPKNPYPLPVRLEALLPDGERRRLVTVEYPGGEFTVPYRLPLGTTLILSLLNRELHRETVAPVTESLSLDQL
ncbi:MAG: PASTA domain-containing protein [Treponema sp.]|jgi:beta-lactam-binding protein with PASTA domain|nr:PASTA domain-containing protein [Treponema sp.]